MLKKFLSRKFIVVIGTQAVNVLIALKVVPEKYKPTAMVIVGALATISAAIYVIVEGKNDKKGIEQEIEKIKAKSRL